MSLEFNEDTLIDLCELVTDGSHHSPPSQVKGYYMASVKDMGTYKFNYSDCRKISEEDYNKLVKSGCSPKNDDILIAKDGSPLSNIFIYKEEYPMVLLSSIAIIRANKNKILPEFLKYYLENHSIKRYIQTTYTSGSVIPRIILKDFKKFPIIYPNMENQKKIIGILRTIDKKIAINEEINQNLTKLIEVNFKNYLLNFDKYPEDELIGSEFGPIPIGWKVSNLTGISNYQNGLAMQKFPPEDSADCFKVLKIKELRQGFFDESSDLCSKNIKEECIVYDGDVIFSWSGSLLVDIWAGGTCGLNQHLFKVTSSRFDKWFYYCWTKFYLNQFILIAKDKATTMGHIKRQNLDESLVLIPNKKTYDNLTKLFQPLFKLLIKNKIEIKKLQILRDTLLPKLMSGEIDVSKINYDLND